MNTILLSLSLAKKRLIDKNINLYQSTGNDSIYKTTESMSIRTQWWRRSCSNCWPWHFCSDAAQPPSRRQRCEQFLVGGSMEEKGGSVPASLGVNAGPCTDCPTWCRVFFSPVRVHSWPPQIPQEIEAFLITAVVMFQVTVSEIYHRWSP